MTEYFYTLYYTPQWIERLHNDDGVPMSKFNLATEEYEPVFETRFGPRNDASVTICMNERWQPVMGTVRIYYEEGEPALPLGTVGTLSFDVPFVLTKEFGWLLMSPVDQTLWNFASQEYIDVLNDQTGFRGTCIYFCNGYWYKESFPLMPVVSTIDEWIRSRPL